MLGACPSVLASPQNPCYVLQPNFQQWSLELQQVAYLPKDKQAKITKMISLALLIIQVVAPRRCSQRYGLDARLT